MKTHIADNTKIKLGQPVLCGRKGVLNTIGTNFAHLWKDSNEDWCKTCKMLYNADHATKKRGD